MIIQLESATPQGITDACGQLEVLTDSWGHPLADPPAQRSEAGKPDTGRDKAIDPVAVAALLVSIPSAALAVVDLADRIQKRRRATELIDQAQRLAAHQVTMYLKTEPPTELATLTPDDLLDLLAEENPTGESQPDDT
jgi:hypothetical protein